VIFDFCDLILRASEASVSKDEALPPSSTLRHIALVFNPLARSSRAAMLARGKPGGLPRSAGGAMAAQNLAGVRACVFDAYGTVFDFNSAAAHCRDVLGDKAPTLSVLWRDKQLQYTWLRSLMGQYADFWEVTGAALDFVLDDLGLADPRLRKRLMDCYLTLDVFPEVPDLLVRLREAGFKCAVLSNGSPRMLAAAVEHAGIGSLLDAVLSVEEAGIYKPHPSVYRLAVHSFRTSPAEIAFLSSNSWDAHGAAVFGFKVVWCNRYGQHPERLPGKPDREVRSLSELPALLGL
jgi:2-haloacid dehalogenase